MSASCYILFSASLDRFYIGVTQHNVASRILKHNNHSYGKHRYTAKAKDWELFLSINLEDYAH
ncbi:MULTISPECIES: GIY-YIG nuclease family protein, partial [unclassified Saccharicrinis]|uniref:GIY-YIG nuclease family protein n=1 Tax=unclassified Saccharicrinis TaxID=2646859 RepID=UPI003D33BFD6